MLQTFFKTAAQSSFVSSIFTIQNAKSVGLFAAVVTSCQAYLQVSFDTTSANFMRASKLDGSGDWTWNVGSGAKAISLQDVWVDFPYARLETSVAQANVCSYTMVVKF